MTRPEPPDLSPFRPGRRRPPVAEPAPDTEADDLERGRTVALLAVMGRVQLKLDQLAKNQSELQSSVLGALAAIESRLASLERAGTTEQPAPEPYAQPGHEVNGG